MQPEELEQLVKRIQKYQCEFQTIEVKAAHTDCPTKLFDTLSSFSNQDDGGILIFGLNEKTRFELVGVYDAQDLQKKVMEQCKQMEPPVRALFTVCEIHDKLVVSAEIPAVDISDRPTFYKGVGRVKGSYIRVGDSDELMSEYEIYSYEAFRKRIQDDIRVVPRGKVSLFNQDKVDEYLRAVKRERKNLASNVSDEEILELMGVLMDGVPTLAGQLCFSKYPQGIFPKLCVTAVSIAGMEMGELGEDGERFIDNERITGSIGEMVESAVDFVRRNSRVKTIIDDEGKRKDKPEYPIKAVREAILNALVHRDYSMHTENVPVRIEMYRNRMEIKSSGGLYGRITIDVLGKVRPDTRNAVLANILEVQKITENRYSGIPTIQREMKNAGLPQPVFEVKRGEFITILYNGKEKENCMVADIRVQYGTNEQQVMEFCKQPRGRDEIMRLLGYSRYYTMSTIINPLLDSGKLKMTIPDKPKSKNQKYYAE